MAQGRMCLNEVLHRPKQWSSEQDSSGEQAKGYGMPLRLLTVLVSGMNAAAWSAEGKQKLKSVARVEVL